jgi:hypothetical protein
MSYVVVEDVAASWEQYARFAAALGDPEPEGLILHAAGPTDEGFRIVGIWASEQAWLRFAERVVSGPWKPQQVLRTLCPEHVVFGRGEGSRKDDGEAVTDRPRATKRPPATAGGHDIQPEPSPASAGGAEKEGRSNE